MILQFSCGIWLHRFIFWPYSGIIQISSISIWADRRIKSVLPSSVLIALANAQSRSYNWFKNLLARAIIKTPKYQHNAPVLHSPYWIPIRQRTHFKICPTVCTSLFSTKPTYLCSMLTVTQIDIAPHQCSQCPGHYDGNDVAEDISQIRLGLPCDHWLVHLKGFQENNWILCEAPLERPRESVDWCWLVCYGDHLDQLQATETGDLHRDARTQRNLSSARAFRWGS